MENISEDELDLIGALSQWVRSEMNIFCKYFKTVGYPEEQILDFVVDMKEWVSEILADKYHRNVIPTYDTVKYRGSCVSIRKFLQNLRHRIRDNPYKLGGDGMIFFRDELVHVLGEFENPVPSKHDFELLSVDVDPNLDDAQSLLDLLDSMEVEQPLNQ